MKLPAPARAKYVGNILSVLLLSVVLIGCQNGSQDILSSDPIMEHEPNIVATITLGNSADPVVPTSTASIAATEAPTPEPLPPVLLSYPEFLSPTVTLALEKYRENPAWRQIETEISEQSADIVLAPGDEGYYAGSRSIALTVPFTSEFESLTVEEAQHILNDGHPTIEATYWSEMPLGKKALRIGGVLPFEEGYSFRYDWSLVAKSGFEETANRLAPIIEGYLNDDNIVHLSAVGDVMLDRALGLAIKQQNPEFPFALVKDELSRADITVGNLESALGELGQPADKSYTFRAPPEAAASLASAGFDIMSLANNHALDYGPESLLQAMDLLAEQSIATIGAGANEYDARKPHLEEIDDISVAFLAYVDVPVEYLGFDTREWQVSDGKPGLVWADLPIVEQDVKLAREGADLVVVVLHSGFEYIEAPSPRQTEISRTAIDAGADLVIGHHAHVLQGIEFYKSGVIAYGLGNFAFEIDGGPETAILNVWLDKAGVRQIEFVPAIVQFGGQPRIANEVERYGILRHIYRLSNTLNSAE